LLHWLFRGFNLISWFFFNTLLSFLDQSFGCLFCGSLLSELGFFGSSLFVLLGLSLSVFFISDFFRGEVLFLFDFSLFFYFIVG
jgi:hypothetical protein